MDPIAENTIVDQYGGHILEANCPLESWLDENNDKLGRSYTFTVTEKDTVDAVNTGNTMRFANHADNFYANCEAKIFYIRGYYQAVLVAKHKIRPNEELFFDYGFKVDLDWLKCYEDKYINGFN